MFKRTKVSAAAALVLGGLAAVTAQPVVAQDTQRIEITGSSIKRIDAESALQVQTVTKSQIEQLGVQSTEQLLMTISALSSSGQTQNSTGAGLSTYGASGVSLRGLGEERTLVLLNGRRLAVFAGGTTVNVNAIPLAAIERVEILKDGASAIYGSDAIGGVVNFILSRNFQGLQLGGSYGAPTTSGGGAQKSANAVFGLGDVSKDRFNLTLTAQFQKDDPLFARDREYAKTGNHPPFTAPSATGQGNIQGAWLPGTGPVNLPGAAYRGSSGSAYGNPLAAPTDQCATINMFWQPTGAAGNPFCIFDSAAFVGLIPKVESTSVTGNFVFKINDRMELFADGIFSKTKVQQKIQPSPLRTSFLETDEAFGPLLPGNAVAPGATDRVLLVRTTNPAYATAAAYLNANGFSQLVGQDLGITARVFDFGNRTQKDTNTQTRFVAGLRGEVLNQSYNVAVATNESKLDGTVTDGYFSQLGFAQATQAPGSDWNPWSLTQSQAFNDAIAPAKYVGPTLTAKSKSTALDATLSGSIMALPAGELQYAAGYQFTKDEINQQPSAALLSGDIAGLGGASKPLVENRKVNALFGELNIPVIKNLDLNLAVRRDDYSDVGATTNHKANIRWQPTKQILVRASYGTGFRAPTLGNLWDPQLLGTSAQFNDPAFNNDAAHTDLQVNEITGGNPLLKPEESKQYSIGIVLQPVAALSVGFDYFDIQVKNVISQPSTQEVVSQAFLGNPAYAGFVVRDPVTNEIVRTTATLANTGTMKVQGVDLDVRFREKVGPGRIDLTWNGTYMIKFDQSTPGAGTSHKVGTTVDGEGNPVISSTANLDGVGVVHRYKQYVSATWTQDNWAATLGNSYSTGYHSGWDLDGNPTRMPALSLWDAQVAYTGIKGLTLAVGARNLFDKQPAIYVPVSNQFQSGYDASQYDPRGRFVYVNASYKFF
jgi:iron complex outermembrane recepter protein